MRSKIIKSLAMQMPGLRQLVHERDRLRKEIAVISMERDWLLRERDDAVSVSERDRLCGEIAAACDERDRLRRNLEETEGAKAAAYCHCCRQNAGFVITGDWLRDQYFCRSCFSIPRQRHIQYVLDKYFKGWEGKRIHESSPANDLISRYCGSYSSSQYLDGVEGGRVVNGVRCENLESLTFEDGTFDIFITQDVFEHIFNPDRAAREIMRVLAPGGAHVFTAPKHKGVDKSYPRARMSGDQIE